MSTHYAEVQEYWNRRPCNVRHSDLAMGSHAYFEAVRLRRYKVESHILPFARFQEWYGKRVLDVGCGIGTDAIEFALHGAEVTAVDMSEASLAITAERAKVYRLEKKVGYALANMEDLPELYGAPFDLIWAWGSIHHTPKPHVALNELRRMCGPRTTLRLMVYNALSTKAIALRMRHGKNARHFSEAQDDCPVTHWYSPGDAVKLVENAGFVVSCVEVDHIFPYDVPAYRRGTYVRRFPWNVIQGPPFRLLERYFGWHVMIEARPTAWR